MMPSPLPRLRPLGRASCIALAFSSAVLALTEIALRLFDISFPNLYQVDDHTAVALRPGVRGWWHKEQRNYVSINRWGQRGRDFSLAKPADTLRIAVLGNSFCEALQVPEEKIFLAISERELRSCPRNTFKNIEAMNFGVSSFTTAQELLTLRHRVWKFEPDVVILTVLTITDVLGNSRELRKATFRPYFRIERGDLVLEDEFRESSFLRSRLGWRWRFLFWCQRHVRLLQIARQARFAYREWRHGETDGLPDYARDVYRPPASSSWESAWRVTERLIVQTFREVEERGARFLLVVLDNPIQVNPSRRVRESYARRIGVEDLFYPDRRLEALARRERMPALILAPELQQYAQQHQVFLHGFGRQDASGAEFSAALGRGHWNELGHEVVGKRIADVLCHELLPLKARKEAIEQSDAATGGAQ